MFNRAPKKSNDQFSLPAYQNVSYEGYFEKKSGKNWIT